MVRGYLAGSGWKEYRASGTVCGIELPPGLKESDRLPEPIFTPATKEESGHDENISFERMVELVGRPIAEELRRRSLSIFGRGSDYARQRGILIADTKFEWGTTADGIILIDEVLTPDSSRFWPADTYQPGRGQPSFDKQFVPRLAGNDQVGQEQSPPGPARRDRGQNAAEVRGSLRASDGRETGIGGGGRERAAGRRGRTLRDRIVASESASLNTRWAKRCPRSGGRQNCCLGKVHR